MPWNREIHTRTEKGPEGTKTLRETSDYSSSGGWGKWLVGAIGAAGLAAVAFQAGSNRDVERPAVERPDEDRDTRRTEPPAETVPPPAAEATVRETPVTFSQETLPLATIDVGATRAVGSNVRVALIIDNAPGLRVCDGDISECADALQGVADAGTKGVVIGHWSVNEDDVSAAQPGTAPRHTVGIFAPQTVTYTDAQGEHTLTLSATTVQVRIEDDAPVALSSVLPSR